MNTMLIVGNGFDLALKLPTSYKDFANSKYWPINGKPSNAGREKNLKNEIYLYAESVKDKESGEIGWMDLEAKIKDYALSKKDVKVTGYASPEDYEDPAIPKDIEFLDALKQLFIKYLRQEAKELVIPKVKGIDEYLVKVITAVHNNDPYASVYSFNYTDTGSILNEFFSWENLKVTHIHGYAFGRHPYICLGVNDRNVVSSKHRFFLKSLQDGFAPKEIYEDLKQVINIVFFGLSFGSNDMDYFTNFFKSIYEKPRDNHPKINIFIFTKDRKGITSIKNFMEDANISVKDLYCYANLHFYPTECFGDNDEGDEMLREFIQLMEHDCKYTNGIA